MLDLQTITGGMGISDDQRQEGKSVYDSPELRGGLTQFEGGFENDEGLHSSVRKPGQGV